MMARREMNSALTLMLAALFSEDFIEARPAQQNTQGHMRNDQMSLTRLLLNRAVCRLASTQRRTE